MSGGAGLEVLLAIARFLLPIDPHHQGAPVPDQPTSLPTTPPTPRRAVTPLKAFAIPTVLIALVAVTTYFSSENSDGEASIHVSAPAMPSATPTLGVTDQEAIQTFRRLYGLGIEAVQSGSRALLSDVFTRDGSSMVRAKKSIDELEESRVTDKTISRIRRATVLNNSAKRILIKSVVVFEPCYITHDGRDVTEGPKRVRRTSKWKMRLVGDEWRIHDAVVLEQRARSPQHARC